MVLGVHHPTNIFPGRQASSCPSSLSAHTRPILICLLWFSIRCYKSELTSPAKGGIVRIYTDKFSSISCTNSQTYKEPFYTQVQSFKTNNTKQPATTQNPFIHTHHTRNTHTSHIKLNQYPNP